MDTKDLIYDIIDAFLGDLDGLEDILSPEEIEELSERICERLGVCVKCGAKLKGERND